MRLNKTLSLLVTLASALLPLILPARSFDRSLERHFARKPKTRIISYNVYTGFSGKSETNRMERFAAWVRGKDPDILGLQELNTFTTRDLKEFAAKWGHPHVAILREGKGSPVGITSRYPITVVNRLEKGFCHGLLHATTRGLDILVTHLNPDDCAARQKEADQIVEYIKGIKNPKVILMGTFIAYSPIDADYMERYATDLRISLYKSPNLAFGEVFDYSAISKFFAVSLYDLCYSAVPREDRITFPAKLTPNYPKSERARKRLGSRIDHIFGTFPVKKVTSEGFIINGADEDFLSDHYPVGIDLVF